MRTQISAMLTTTFTLQGEAATYTPNGGSPVAVTIMPMAEDETLTVGDTQIFTETFLFNVLVSEVASPAADDTVLWNGTTFVLTGPPARQDRLQLVWTILTRKQ